MPSICCESSVPVTIPHSMEEYSRPTIKNWCLRVSRYLKIGDLYLLNVVDNPNIALTLTRCECEGFDLFAIIILSEIKSMSQ